VDHLENFYGKCHPMKTDEAGKDVGKQFRFFSRDLEDFLWVVVTFLQVSRDIFGRDVDAAQMQMKTFCSHFLINYECLRQ